MDVEMKAEEESAQAQGGSDDCLDGLQVQEDGDAIPSPAEKHDHDPQPLIDDGYTRNSDLVECKVMKIQGHAADIVESDVRGSEHGWMGSEQGVDEGALHDVSQIEADECGKRSDGTVDKDGGSSEMDNINTELMKKSHVEVMEVMPVKEEEGEGDLDPSTAEARDTFLFSNSVGADDDGSLEEQEAFLDELAKFYQEKGIEFKPPKFYKEGLNCLKLWRQVTGLGGYDQVTASKLWRQVGESFNPPKTCTTISWTFRNFYEKALLDYEKHKIQTGDFVPAAPTHPDPIAIETQTQVANQASVSGRAIRESAARAMQGWHSQRLLSNGEIGDPIIKGKGSVQLMKKDRTQKISESLKRKKTSSLEQDDTMVATKVDKRQTNTMVLDVGAPADWVKINVRKTKDCYEIYALVPGLLREEVHVQLDPAGRLIISGAPEHPDNLWGVTPFKKVVSLPSRIDPHNSSAVVTLHGQLFVRAPYEQLKA